MSQTAKPVSGILHATLREVEPGLFSADYRGELNQEEVGPEAYPDSHIGTDAMGVKHWVEDMALRLGYEQVVWEPTDAPDGSATGS